MDPAIRQLIEALHHAPHQCVLAVTGGGTQAAALLLNVPGGSRTVLEVVVPYHEQALGDFLGHRPEQFCSAATTRAMAARAWERARHLAPGMAVVGVGCTATLATDRPKRGDHRFHVAADTGEQSVTFSLVLHKGTRDREGEEAILDAVLLNALAEAFEVPLRAAVPLWPDEILEVERLAAAGPLASFLRGETATVCLEMDGRARTDSPRPAGLLSGSFNPLHVGHCLLAEVAATMIGGPVAFELTVVNADKAALPNHEVRRRLGQFAWRAPLWLTRAPTFAEKADLFPGTVFVVGADTAARIVECRFYQDDEGQRGQAMDHLRARGCRFLVAGRVGPDRRFLGLEELSIPAAFRDLFQGIPEAAFRMDISSTQLRQQADRQPVAK